VAEFDVIVDDQNSFHLFDHCAPATKCLEVKNCQMVMRIRDQSGPVSVLGLEDAWF
jgi:hypothetical protein